MGRYIVSSFSVDGKGYFTGGGSAHWKYNNDTWQYDPVANSWKSVGAYGKAHVSDAAFTVNGKGYVSCGAETSTVFKNDCWEWNPVLSKWKECKKLPFSPRVGIMPFAIGNYGYLAGGVDQDLKHLNELWEFGPAVPPVEKPKAEEPPVAAVPPVKPDKQQQAVLPDPALPLIVPIAGMIVIKDVPPPAPESTYVAPQPEPAEILITEETNSKEDITLLFYPNPFTDEATVVLSREMETASLQVFDLTGKLIKEFVFSGKETRIDRVHMDCGTYFYSVSEKGKMIGSGKFIVQ